MANYNHTFSSADAEACVVNKSSLNAVYTIPASTTWDADIGTKIDLLHNSGNGMTIGAANGVTIVKLASKSLTSLGSGSRVTIQKIAQDTWFVSGDLAGA